MKDNAEIAYEVVKEKIFSQEFRAGQKLREEMLVGILEMSRTPIRTALNNLAHDGLVTIVPKRYCMVKQYTKEEIEQIGVARLSLDLISTNLAIYYGSNAEMYRLLKLCDMQEQAVNDRNDILRRKIDCDFHLEITKISKNGFLYDMQKSLYLRVRHILSTNDADKLDRYASVNSHREIVEAMLVRDRGKALKLVREHLCNYYQFDAENELFDFYTVDLQQNDSRKEKQT